CWRCLGQSWQGFRMARRRKETDPRRLLLLLLRPFHTRWRVCLEEGHLGGAEGFFRVLAGAVFAVFDLAGHFLDHGLERRQDSLGVGGFFPEGVIVHGPDINLLWFALDPPDERFLSLAGVGRRQDFPATA